MNRLTLLLVSGCLWAAMMFLLFEREIRPYFEYQQPPSYRQLLRDRKDAEVTLRRIQFAQQKIGDAESMTEPLPDGGYRMTTRLVIKMGVFMRSGLPAGLTLPDDRIFLVSVVRVDDAYQLSEIELEAGLQGMGLKVRGVREGDRLKVKYDFLGIHQGEQSVHLPPDATLSDNFMPYQGGARLTVGKKWRMRILDLDNLIGLNSKQELSFSEVYATVVGREALKHHRRELAAFKVEVRKNPTDELPAYTLWVDDEGTVLQQQMTIQKLPCTFTLADRRRMTPDEARAYSWQVQPPR